MQKNINLKVETETYKLVKIRAAEIGTTIKVAVNEALLLWIERTKK